MLPEDDISNEVYYKVEKDSARQNTKDAVLQKNLGIKVIPIRLHQGLKL
jgi:hypothetical protein